MHSVSKHDDYGFLISLVLSSYQVYCILLLGAKGPNLLHVTRIWSH